jgi:hypothetical protein
MRRGPSLPEANYGLVRRFAAKRLFHRMVARQHIRLDTVPWRASEAIIYRALHTCSHCREKASCAAWLARKEPSRGYVRFCPNSEAIETLRIMTR